MSSTPLAPASATAPASVASPSHSPAAQPGRAARSVLAMLQGLEHGTLDLHTPWGQHRLGNGAGPLVQMQVHDASLFARVLRDGDIGLAEAWMDGHWHTPDLPELLALLMQHRSALERAVYGSLWGRVLHRLLHGLRRNTRGGSRRNVQAHYDLGNAFYALWLDDTMNYSSALYAGEPGLSLAQAQNRKVARALDEAGIAAGSKVLEIGCGWGAVAEAAARRGANVVGVTLSHEQLAWARQRLAVQGLDGQASLRLQDYRDLPADTARQGWRYDAVVSIEMIEAVGRAYWPAYFQTLAATLAPGGRACVQSIVIRDDLFDRYARGSDFIQKHVFPGGMLPCPAEIHAQAGRAGLVVLRELAFGRDYATTLRLWRAAFLAQREPVLGQGFDERFVRLWDFYLAYCEAAFTTGQTNVVQYTLAHAGSAP